MKRAASRWLASVLVCSAGAGAGEALPPGAIARFGRAPLHHGTLMGPLAFSPDGRVLASSGYRCRPNDIALWDMATGRLLHSLGGGDRRMYAMAFFPDGKTLFAASMDGKGCYWDVATGKPTTLYKIPSHLRTSSISALMWLAISPDGRTVAAQSYSQVEVFDAVTGRQLCTIKEHHLGALSPDGKLLAATGISGSTAGARLFDPATGKLVRQMDTSGQRCARATFSPDGALLAASCTEGKDIRTVVLWETKTGKVARKLPVADGALYYRELAFHPGGGLLAGASWMAGIHVWDVKAGKLVRNLTVPGERLMAVAFSPDGSLLAAGGNSLPTGGRETAQVHLWDTDTWRERAISAAYRGPLLAAAASADGRRVLTGNQDGTAVLWDGRTGKQLLRLPNHVRGASAVAISRDGRSLFTAAAGKDAVRLWDADTGGLRREIAVPGGAGRRIALLPEERKLVAFGSTGSASLVDLRTHEVRLLEKGDGTNGLTLAVSADGRVAASSYGSNRKLVHAWELLPARRIAVLGPWTFCAMALDPTARLLAGDSGQRIALFELDSGTAALTVATSQRYSGTRRCVAFARDGKVLAAGEVGGGIGLWSVRTGRKLGERKGHRGQVTVMEFLPDGHGLLSGASDGTAVLWELEDITEAVRAEKRKVDANDLPGLWSLLASKEAPEAHEAVFRLADAGDACAAFLAERLAPARGPSTDEVRTRIAELGDKRFAVRRRATEELARLGALAEPELRKALDESTGEEVRARIKQLLKPFDDPPRRSGEVLRQLRAVHVLERIASPKAVAVLKGLSRGSPHAGLSRRAAAALERLERLVTRQ